MDELRTLLLEHAARYPQMRPTDAVKLIYQNEFGGGHLIRDEQACLQYLRREYDSIEKDPSLPRQESIGNGIVRVNLAALEEEALDQLGRDFIRSAAAHKGTQERFLAKLELLTDLVRQGLFPFSEEELREYLAAYEQQGYPPVSHSEAYRRAYRPAYRVIKADQ